MQTPRIETSAELRRLYADAESRATRLRVLLEISRAVATAHGQALDEALALAAQRAALLAGYRYARIVGPHDAPPPHADARTFPLIAPGGTVASAGLLLVEDALRPDGEPTGEDAEAVALITQLMGAALASREREAQLAALVDELLAAQERERSHVARELHDGVAQLATAVLRRVELAADEDGGVGRADALRAAELTRELVTELRRVIAGMRPTTLDDLGLAPAMAQLADQLREAGWDVQLDVADLPPLAARLETELFRLLQESLANVQRHAGLCRVEVTLTHDTATRTIVLTVRDTGRGFDPEARPRDGRQHFGLAFMRERARALGGHFCIDAGAGAGCTVRASVRLP